MSGALFPPPSHFIPVQSKPLHRGAQHIYKFPNGFGASVICTMYSRGGPNGLWELGVLDELGDLTYSTPITDDVIGYLEDEEVCELLTRINALSREVTA
ncbi:hypothetical protein AUR04nite_00260 [Glutamicibacter uratoxydans]|uniref:Uncharacterized protein n=1 Tax=Glutamicibacter uratoxydans TaxID=43667 RepID=A0A4Y4DKZ3_GLUUR|nr:hypothetical protein [Glutamicibacter uratoxydans]GED04494.1 hypothetical protein AUR04nite_00260 [Glutamicibacter uratoxydans]